MRGSHVCGSCKTLADVGVGVLNRCWQPPAGHVDDLLQLQQFSHEHGFLFRVTAFQFEGFGGNNTALRKAYQTPEFLEKLDSVSHTLAQAPINNTSTYLERMKEYFVRPKYHPFHCEKCLCLRSGFG